MVASGPAIGEAYTTATGRTVSGADEVARLAEQGDPVALAVWDDAVSALAEAVAVYAETMNPSLVVVGGGVGRAEALLVERLAAALRPQVRFADPPPAVVAAQHGADAAIVGVAAVAHDLAASGSTFGVPFFVSPATRVRPQPHDTRSTP